jgi:catechol 2,3-dioxygenase-like lactoylglutathione lyase family enzyme
VDLNQVTLPVDDMVKASDFYRRMGFLQIVDTPHYARFECAEGNSTFSLSLDSGEIRSSTVIYFEHENLAQLVVALTAKGIVFDQEPTDMSYLWREAILHDPSGNKIKFYWAGTNRMHPPWRVERNA